MGLSSKQVSVDIHYWPQGELEFPKPEVGEEKQNAPLRKCPRCESTNTKFCYYNNYSRSQPRHFCRVCRRHWTEGGALRNIPVGGGRKNKRRRITSTAASTDGAAARNPTAPVIGESGGPIFPNVLRQVPLFPPALQAESPTAGTVNGLFGTSLPNTSPTFMEDFNGVSSALAFSEVKVSFTAAASSFSSSQYNWSGVQNVGGGCEDGVLGMMDASTATAWANKETVFPASYWDFWDGGAVDLSDPDSVQPVVP